MSGRGIAIASAGRGLGRGFGGRGKGKGSPGGAKRPHSGGGKGKGGGHRPAAAASLPGVRARRPRRGLPRAEPRRLARLPALLRGARPHGLRRGIGRVRRRRARSPARLGRSTSEAERTLLLEQIEGLVPAVDAKFEGQSSAQELERLAGRRMAQWRAFKAWLAKAGAPYDCIIDGANVGYHGANYAGAPDAVDFRQVDAVLRKCIDGGRRALVVLHARHLQDDRLPASARPVLHAWRRSKSLYSCALRNNDDWYWLYAAVAAGPGSLLVSNDEMRDHHFGMLSARAFLVWKERHLAKFELGGWRRDGGRDVTIHDPPPFSVRAQRNDPARRSRAGTCPRCRRRRRRRRRRASTGPPTSRATRRRQVHGRRPRPKLDAVKWLVCSKP
ncbi:hypothetical protein JL720_10722 [Aureococcus anophagefferens]|nr:hypothetical protein JL720_10722 [Aureococcus anophagefferens]